VIDLAKGYPAMEKLPGLYCDVTGMMGIGLGEIIPKIALFPLFSG